MWVSCDFVNFNLCFSGNCSVEEGPIAVTWHQPNVWWGASTWLDCIKFYDKRVLWKSKHFVGSLATSSGNWHTDLFEQVVFFCGHLFSSSGFSSPTTLLSVISEQLRQGSVGWQMVGTVEASDGSAQPCAPGWAWTWPGTFMADLLRVAGAVKQNSL